MLLLVVMLVGVIPFNAFAANDSDEYDWQGKWIWTSDSLPSGKDGQWVNMRKTFTLNSVPSSVEARISVDSRYWMWINGEMAVYEGQLKGGPDQHSWYYDVVDIAPYLKEGENTIAILACYWGFQSASTVPTGKQALLFDAIFPAGALSSGTRIISDDSWKVQKDPAYKAPPSRENARPDAVDVKYDARSAVEGWQEIGFNDSAWAKATVKKLSSSDPRNKLVERAIPQWNVKELVKHGPDDWTVDHVPEFSSLNLPSTYTVTAELKSLNSKSIGVAVCMTDKGHFYMPQIQGQGKLIKPHRQNGSWKTDYTLEGGASVSVPTNQKITVKIEVTGTKITTYVNGQSVGSFTDSTLARAGSSVGFRHSSGEEIAVYSMKVTDSTGKLLWEDNISESYADGEITVFKKLSGGQDPALKTDENGNTYLYLCDNVVIAGEQVKNPNADKIYSFYNATNMQGAPYIKVKSTKGGETIHITSDATNHAGGEAVSHYYVTKVGEQEWEAFNWTNAYRVDVRVPVTVEVIELGWRESSYGTEHTGNVTTDNELLNQLYKEAYDTLLITMRDTYMDCPDRERTQWWGDAVLEMQQAAYAMDEDARYLYKKLLTQVVGWAEGMDGSLPNTPTDPSHKELHAQSVAGVHSLWQYYLYYGETDILEFCYQPFIDFLKLWDVSDTGYVTHRGGTSDWIDWDGNVDAAVSDQCWYYIALVNMKNVAEVLGKPQSDIDFLVNRMTLIKDNFDTMFWNTEKNAYYSNVSNGKPDDRAQAMAVYAGLADPARYPRLVEIIKNTQNASPYVEKYVLESLYMMGYADVAIERTLDRYGVMLSDSHPTLYESFSTKGLSGNGNGTATRNHAWSGGPLSLTYMYIAGITSTGAGFKTFRIRPQLGSLNNVSAKTETMYGYITVNATKTSLAVTVPAGTTAEICVPRLDGATTIKLGGVVVYDNGSPTASLPTGVSYSGEDTDYVFFTVKAGSYSFTMTNDGSDSAKSFTVTATDGGSVTVNGVKVNGSYTYTGTGSVTVVMTPDAGYRVATLTGSVNENVYSATAVTRTVTLNGGATLNVSFDQPLDKKHNITIVDMTSDPTSNNSKLKGMHYAFRVFVNGEEVFMKHYIRDNMLALPYMVTANDGETVTISVKPVDEKNYDIYVGDGKGNISSGDLTLTPTSDIKLTITVVEKATVKKLQIQKVTATSAQTNSSVWKLEMINDGIRVSSSDAYGYSSEGYLTDTPSNAISLIMDLGSVQTFNQVSLYPRNAFESITGGARCFPKDYTISVSSDGITYKTVVTVKNAEDPHMHQVTHNFSDTDARYVRLAVTKLGAPELTSSDNKYRLQLAEIEIAKVTAAPVIVIPPSGGNNTGNKPDNNTETDVITPEETTTAVVETPAPKGCGSSVGYGLVTVLVSTAAACCLGKRRNKKNDR